VMARAITALLPWRCSKPPPWLLRESPRWWACVPHFTLAHLRADRASLSILVARVARCLQRTGAEHAALRSAATYAVAALGRCYLADLDRTDGEPPAPPSSAVCAIHTAVAGQSRVKLKLRRPKTSRPTDKHAPLN
jgi:hypothetical protein